MAALGGIPQQALSDSAFSSSMNEKSFQAELVKRLRAVDYSGGNYQKRENKNLLQAHQYAVTSGKKVCMLCTLRPANKKEVSQRAEEMIEVRSLEDGSIAFIVKMLCRYSPAEQPFAVVKLYSLLRDCLLYTSDAADE